LYPGLEKVGLGKHLVLNPAILVASGIITPRAQFLAQENVLFSALTQTPIEGVFTKLWIEAAIGCRSDIADRVHPMLIQHIDKSIDRMGGMTNCEYSIHFSAHALVTV
jgi:hypothetical protein